MSFPRQQPLGERASILRYSCFVSLVIFYNSHIFILIFCKCCIAVESGKFEMKNTGVTPHYRTDRTTRISTA